MRTNRQLSALSFGDRMTHEEAMQWLGESHMAYLSTGGHSEAGQSSKETALDRVRRHMAGAWTANNGVSFIAYDAILREWTPRPSVREIEAQERRQEAADLRNGRYSTIGEEVA